MEGWRWARGVRLMLGVGVARKARKARSKGVTFLDQAFEVVGQLSAQAACRYAHLVVRIVLP